MFSVTELCDEIRRKRSELAGEMSHCEWKRYAEVLDETYPVMQEELAIMRKQYWESEKVGTRVMLYSDPHIQEYKYHKVNGTLEIKEEYTELYDPVQECWINLERRIFQKTIFPLVREPVIIVDVFVEHLIYASMAYQWGKSVMSENERIALKAFITATSLFDKSIGMIWFKAYADKKKNYRALGLKLERKVGKVKQKCTLLFRIN